MSSVQTIAVTQNIALLPALELVVTLDRLNIESGGQAVAVFRSPANVMDFMRYEADDRGSPGLAGLFDHLSGFKNRLVDFHLGYDVSETALVLTLSKQTAELVMEALQRALGITTHEAKVRLSAAISALAKLSQLDDTARSLNKRMIEFRISAEGIVAERPVAN